MFRLIINSHICFGVICCSSHNTYFYNLYRQKMFKCWKLCMVFDVRFMSIWFVYFSEVKKGYLCSWCHKLYLAMFLGICSIYLYVRSSLRHITIVDKDVDYTFDFRCYRWFCFFLLLLLLFSQVVLIFARF